jgi:hypothetical protein
MHGKYAHMKQHIGGGILVVKNRGYQRESRHLNGFTSKGKLIPKINSP